MRSRRRDRASNHRSLPPQGDLASAKPSLRTRDRYHRENAWPRAPRSREMAQQLSSVAESPSAFSSARSSLESPLSSARRGISRAQSRSTNVTIAITEKALGPEHPDLAISLNNFALLLKDQVRSRRRDRASNHRSLPPAGGSRELLSRSTNARSLSARKRSVPSTRILRYSAQQLRWACCKTKCVLVARSSLESPLSSARRGISRAPSRSYERAIAIDEKTLGPDHPEPREIG